jgi:anti-sigma regulatory factor (Ser/Thr protein kinase)
MCACLPECHRPATEREIRLEPTVTAPREARRFVSRHLTDLGYPTLTDDGALVVSELVTNSLAAAPRTPIWVTLRLVGRLALLEVWDCSPVRPVIRAVDDTAEHGRGLHVVKESSLTWGCDTFVCGKVIWVLLG